MIFELLDKDGLKNLRNVLIYFVDPSKIEYKGIRTKLGNKDYRKDIIINSFKNLEDKDRKEIIKYIRDKEDIIKEYIFALDQFNEEDNWEDISRFISDLMFNIEDESYKLKIFKLIFTNDRQNALDIMIRTREAKFKQTLYKECISLNPERGYIYGLLSGVMIESPPEMNINELLNEINIIQNNTDKLILEIILDNIYFKDDLINEINKRVGLIDFKTLYMLARNLKVLDSYEINVNKNELLFLKWIDENAKLKQINDKVFIEGLNKYSDRWLIAVTINLLKLDYGKQKIAILILNEFINSKRDIKKYSDELAKAISSCIKEKEATRSELYIILGKLDTLVGFYEIITLIEDEGFEVIKKDNMMSYINKIISKSYENIWFNEIKETNEYLNPREKLKSKVITFVLMKKTKKEAYDFLTILKEKDYRNYNNIMNDFTELIVKNIDPERYMEIIILMDYKCTNKIVASNIEKYYNDNIDRMKAIMKAIDPKLLEKHYAEEILLAIKENRSKEVKKLLDNIEDSEVMKECSFLIVEELIENRLNDLIDLWDNLELYTDKKIEVRDKVFSLISEKKLVLTNEVIAFADNIGIESMKLYKLMGEDNEKDYLLNIWYESDKSGKIIEVLKEKLTKELVSLDDIEDIEKSIKKYGIKDSNLNALIKIKAYGLISIELLLLDFELDENLVELNELIDKLERYKSVNRFLQDELIRNELDSRTVDYIIRRLMESVQSNDLLEFYWKGIVSDINNRNYIIAKKNMDIFFISVTKSMERIEWFLGIIENIDYGKEINVNIFEALLILLNKNNRINLQNQLEIDNSKEKLLNDLGSNIGTSLGNLEKAIANNKDDILLENMKRLRRNLKSIGIGSVENIDNYGQVVKFDINKHGYQNGQNLEDGIVDSLGISIKDDIIQPSTLLKID